MENPDTWGKAEHVVHEAMLQYDDIRASEMCGISEVRYITDALRREGLLLKPGDHIWRYRTDDEEERDDW